MVKDGFLHPGTTICLNGQAVMLTGPSGAGKSDLALRLIDRGFVLVSDDQTLFEKHDNQLWAKPAPNIEGRIEVRGLGIVPVAYEVNRILHLVVSLVPRDHVDRMPDQQVTLLSGIEVPHIRLHSFDASTPLKIEYALKNL